MPAQFKIIPPKQLVLYTYSGDVTFRESQNIVAASTQDPQYKPWFRQLCDLSRVTSVETDFAALMKMQAKMVESLNPTGPDLLVVFFAPSRVALEMATMARKSWEGLSSVIVLVQDQEARALNILGLAESRIDQLSGQVV
jgi:hypothetical protein